MQRSRRTNVERLVERQISLWQAQRRAGDEGRSFPPQSPDAVFPYVAVSRQIGSEGNDLAAQLADRLGFQLYDREIVDYIAERANVRVAAVKSLGETWFNSVHNWISGVIDHRFLAADDYARHLVEAVGTIARQESAVFVGRGVGFFLPRSRGIHVRVIASLDKRVERAAARYGISEVEARQLCARSDASRTAFTRAYFNVDVTDPQNYDVCLNTNRLSIEDCVEACATLLRGTVSLTK